MIKIKIPGLYSSDFSAGETRLGDNTIITNGEIYEVIDGLCDRGATRLISRLKSMGVKSPYLHISHPHYDHYDGIDKILSDAYFKQKALYCQDPNSITAHNRSIRSDINALKDIIAKAKGKEIPVIYLDNEQKVEHGDIKFNVYRQYPKYSGNSEAYLNDGSLCYWFPSQRYLTTGDASMWCAYKYGLHPLIVKGGHHGNDMSADGYLKPSQMCPWLKQHGCRFYWDNDFSTRLTDFLMTGRDDAINAGMIVLNVHGDIDMEFARGKVTITHAGKTYTDAVPYNGDYIPGWIKNSTGWWYRNADGSWPADCTIDLPWSKGISTFCFDSRGYMVIGWRKIEGKWYYFDENGAMVTGWRKINGKWYYLSRWEKGAMLTGWQKLDEKWYYFDNSGAMVTGWHQVERDGELGWFYLDPINGNMRTGWVYDNKSWYYLNPETGMMQTGWLDYDGKRCYLEPVSGKNQGHCYVATTATIDGKTYRFDKDGYVVEISGDVLITKVVGKLNEVGATRLRFVLDIANYVRKYAPQYDIKVYSPIIAQAIHESGWGESKLSAKYHNYFGMKCGTKWTGRSVNMKTQEEYSAGSLSTISANFRAYDSMEEGVKGYFEFIQLPRYANLKGVTDPRQYLQNIKDDGYATGSQYVNNTMNLVNLYDLTQFDVSLPSEEPKQQGQREAIVSEAISHIGVKEGTVLHHKIIDRYNSRKPLPRGYAVKYTDAWCATFISYLAIVMGYTDIIPVECGCPQMITLAKQMGIWVEDDSYVPKPGDIVLYDWQDSGSGDNTGNADHIGLVEKVVGNTETVIEGNYQDSVKRRELAVNGRYIRGYIVPRYK